MSEGAKVVKKNDICKGKRGLLCLFYAFLMLFYYSKPLDGVFVGCSRGIRRLYVCIGYVSVMYRLCIGNGSEDTGSNLGSYSNFVQGFSVRNMDRIQISCRKKTSRDSNLIVKKKSIFDEKNKTFCKYQKKAVPLHPNVKKMHKSGFVNIVGNPNVGKSTLMNVLVGERLSIITSKAQTTRHRIMGIVNGDDFQMVYSDTPGVLQPNYKLQEQMLEFSRSALVDADVLLYVTDVQDNPEKNADFLEKVKRIKAKVFLIINKIDLTTQETLEQLVEYWHRVLPEATVFPISAQQKFGTDQLFTAIREALPECPPFFPKDQLTDKSSRFFVDEMIREKILLNYDKEIPYSVEVEVETFHDEEPDEQHPEGIIRIGAVIFVERDSQKGIIIGKGGKALKRVGTQARKEIEAFFGKPVFLQLFVKVDKDWRSSQTRLRHYGYDLN